MSFVTSPHAGRTTNWVAVPGNDDEMTAQGVEVQTLRMKLSIGPFPRHGINGIQSQCVCKEHSDFIWGLAQVNPVMLSLGACPEPALAILTAAP